MDSVFYPYRKKTASVCPVCGSTMYMVHWYDKTRSLMCLKCHFGFNYKQ